MSAASQPASRERVLAVFQEVSGFGFDDSIQFLNQYHWNLESILEDFYNKKDFKKTLTHNSNEKPDFQQTATHYPSLGSFYTKSDRKQQTANNNDDDDRYTAELLSRYGDADELARRHWRDRQKDKQPQKQTQGNTQTEPIYHEKQEFLRCGIHSLNNLFQIPHLFTPEHLDRIVHEFDQRYANNDYGMQWVGDYDLRILIEAIIRSGYLVRQINYINESLQNLPWDSYFGLLINLNGAHWFTIKNLNGIYYNLDSTFSKPSQIGQKDALVSYIIRLIYKFKSVYIFAVLQQTNRS